MIEWIRRLVRRGEPTPGQRAADGALERAQSALREAEERRPLVEAAARRLRLERAENHFADRIRAALEGGAQ
jgi:Tfp pilus assembly protein PilX